jgi:predicted permease
MASVIGLVLPFFGLIVIGYGAARITKQPLEALGWMNTFIIYIALPALFFKLLAKTPVEQLVQWQFIVATTFSTFIIFAAAFLLGALKTNGRVGESAIIGFASAYGNIGYMGPGLALLAFGEAAVVPVALIFCFDNILHFVLAPFLMAFRSNGDEQPALAKLMAAALWRIISHPFILATIVGVTAAVFQYQPPDAAQTLIDYLANAAAPCALFAMGVSLALRPLKRVPVEASFILPLKLVVQPLLAYWLVTSLGDFPPIWVYSAMLLAGLPSATNVFVIAQQYDVWTERASAMVLLTTIASVVTVTALLYLTTNGLIPL